MIAVAGILNIKTTTLVYWIAKRNRECPYNAAILYSSYLKTIQKFILTKMKASTI